MLRVEFSKAMGSIWPRAHKRAKGKRFRGNMGKNVQRVSRNDVRELRDYSNAIPTVRGLIGRCVSRWSSMRKSRGRVRT